jgi:hypothetical protein
MKRKQKKEDALECIWTNFPRNGTIVAFKLSLTRTDSVDTLPVPAAVVSTDTRYSVHVEKISQIDSVNRFSFSNTFVAITIMVSIQ